MVAFSSHSRTFGENVTDDSHPEHLFPLVETSSRTRVPSLENNVTIFILCVIQIRSRSHPLVFSSQGRSLKVYSSCSDFANGLESKYSVLQYWCWCSALDMGHCKRCCKILQAVFFFLSLVIINKCVIINKYVTLCGTKYFVCSSSLLSPIL